MDKDDVFSILMKVCACVVIVGVLAFGISWLCMNWKNLTSDTKLYTESELQEYGDQREQAVREEYAEFKAQYDLAMSKLAVAKENEASLQAQLDEEKSKTEQNTARIAELESQLEQANADKLSFQNEVTRLKGLLDSYADIAQETYEITFYNGDEIYTTRAIAMTNPVIGNDETIGTPLREDYEFVGWSLTSDGDILNLNTYSFEQSTNLYAIFAKMDGLYDENGVQLYSWQELMDNNYFGLSTSGVLKRSSKTPELFGKLILSDEVKTLDGTFKDCVNLTEISCPGVKIVEGYAFYGCHRLRKINFSNNLTSIYGGLSFYHTYSLFSITLPSSLQNCYNVGTFGSVSCLAEIINLSSVEINRGDLLAVHSGESRLQTIENVVYYVYENDFIAVGSSVLDVSTINISAECTEIRQYAFAWRTFLKSAYISSSVTKIEKYAFNHCTSLKSIYLPSTITTIEANAFFGSNADLVIYCGATKLPSGWSSDFNCHLDYTDKDSTYFEVKYGYTYDEYLAEI